MMVLYTDVKAYDLIEVSAAGAPDLERLDQLQALVTASVIASTARSNPFTSTRSL